MIPGMEGGGEKYYSFYHFHVTVRRFVVAAAAFLET